MYDRFSRFIVVKKSDLLSARSTICLLLEVFAEHGVPSSIRCDCGHNFMSSDFSTFCTDLNINLCFSSAYHHSSNMAERAVLGIIIYVRKVFTCDNNVILTVFTPAVSTLVHCRF